MKQRKTIEKSGYQISNRQLRVGELVRRAIANILSRGNFYDELLQDANITVSEVRCSSDLKIARVYVLPLGGESSNEIVAALTKSKPALRKSLAKELDLKFVPDLRFIKDESFDQADYTRKLLNKPTVKKDIYKNENDGGGK